MRRQMDVPFMKEYTALVDVHMKHDETCPLIWSLMFDNTKAVENVFYVHTCKLPTPLLQKTAVGHWATVAVQWGASFEGNLVLIA